MLSICKSHALYRLSYESLLVAAFKHTTLRIRKLDGSRRDYGTNRGQNLLLGLGEEAVAEEGILENVFNLRLDVSVVAGVVQLGLDLFLGQTLKDFMFLDVVPADALLGRNRRETDFQLCEVGAGDEILMIVLSLFEALDAQLDGVRVDGHQLANSGQRLDHVRLGIEFHKLEQRLGISLAAEDVGNVRINTGLDDLDFGAAGHFQHLVTQRFLINSVQHECLMHIGVGWQAVHKLGLAAGGLVADIGREVKDAAGSVRVQIAANASDIDHEAEREVVREAEILHFHNNCILGTASPLNFIVDTDRPLEGVVVRQRACGAEEILHSLGAGRPGHAGAKAFDGSMFGGHKTTLDLGKGITAIVFLDQLLGGDGLVGASGIAENCSSLLAEIAGIAVKVRNGKRILGAASAKRHRFCCALNVSPNSRWINRRSEVFTDIAAGTSPSNMGHCMQNK